MYFVVSFVFKVKLSYKWLFCYISLQSQCFIYCILLNDNLGNIEPHFVTFKQKFKKKLAVYDAQKWKKVESL